MPYNICLTIYSNFLYFSFSSPPYLLPISHPNSSLLPFPFPATCPNEPSECSRITICPKWPPVVTPGLIYPNRLPGGSQIPTCLKCFKESGFQINIPKTGGASRPTCPNRRPLRGRFQASQSKLATRGYPGPKCRKFATRLSS